MVNNVLVAITGMGAISALGGSVSETLLAFEQERCLPGPVTLFDTELAYPVFEVKNFSHSPRLMRTVALCMHAVDEALSDAGLPQKLSGYRVGVCLGTTVASQLNDTAAYKSYTATGEMPAAAVDRYLDSNLAEAIARHVRAQGPRVTVVNACSSGTDALGMAYSWLCHDYCDIVIAGGADELNRVPYCGFGSLGVASLTPCAPFDAHRNGLNLGEGAGILVLERVEHARARSKQADVYCAAYAAAADAYHLTAPRPDGSGLEAALRQALSEAGAHARDIAFVNAHGTATRDNDKVEGNVLARVFGPTVNVLSTKGYTGHALGAAGGLEAVFTALGLRHGWVPPSAGFNTNDPEIPLEPVREKTKISGRFVVSTSLAFGGNNAALVLGRN